MLNSQQTEQKADREQKELCESGNYGGEKPASTKLELPKWVKQTTKTNKQPNQKMQTRIYVCT